uniref:Uncharacterized protein n=1 Tax=Cacopsylla melanoneura TaxID=428564 RepID=A0A8D8Z7W4_9HEMI
MLEKQNPRHKQWKQRSKIINITRQRMLRLKINYMLRPKIIRKNRRSRIERKTKKVLEKTKLKEMQTTKTMTSLVNLNKMPTTKLKPYESWKSIQLSLHLTHHKTLFNIFGNKMISNWINRRNFKQDKRRRM